MSRAFNIGTIHSRTTDYSAFRFRVVFDNNTSGVKPPNVSLYRYTHGDSVSGLVAPWDGTTHRLTLPHIRFGWAYKYRHFGALHLYKLVSTFYRRTIGY